ncbi:MAG: KpsF/GutQ family sugar-phosphate isomerase [Bacteroidales bacterium]|nr:KpsF/GutQ family sugar-phosphate isomerase [Bacteroidales bacterium]MBS3774443.1 KpsF/GutQ family sugar-phosphate isomerase [Bacteroidales bacterium]
MGFDVKKLAKETIIQESKSVRNLANYINEDFENIVHLIYHSKGRVVITGIGKSAIIAEKIVGTLNSTGTPAIFMHAADAIHGDLGIIQKEDIIICISKSGNTPEIEVLVPLLKYRNNPLIAMISTTNSFLGRNAHYIIQTTIDKEACPHNLAPTSSTTAQLVMGDALAICLLEYRGFSREDYAQYHPGGALGKKLYLTVEKLYKQNEVPQVRIDDSIKHTIMEISSKRLGATAVLNDNKLVGIITDGDLRRMLERHDEISNLKARDIMTTKPKTIKKNELAINAFNMMEDHNITQLIVKEDGTYLGMVHLHDILKEGIV